MRFKGHGDFLRDSLHLSAETAEGAGTEHMTHKVRDGLDFEFELCRDKFPPSKFCVSYQASKLQNFKAGHTI